MDECGAGHEPIFFQGFVPQAISSPGSVALLT
jgi:hypothetical protein